MWKQASPVKLLPLHNKSMIKLWIKDRNKRQKYNKTVDKRQEISNTDKIINGQSAK